MIKAENRAYIEDLSYDNAEEFLHDISYGGKLYKIFDSNFIFRGHSTDEYKLLSSVQRINPYFEKYGYNKNTSKEFIAFANTEFSQAFHEYQYLEDFFKKCDENHLYVPEVRRMREAMPWNLKGIPFLLEKGEWLPEELFELTTFAQHHGVPTRLLDWTQDINTALYFAVSGIIQKRGNPEKLTYREWTDKQMDFLKRAVSYYKTKGVQSNNKGLRIEIWALDKRTALIHSGDNPLRIIHPSYYNNENLAAQKGLLSFWEIKKPITSNNDENIPSFSWKDEKTLDEHITEFLLEKGEPSKPYLYNITLPETSISELYKFIKRNRCDASSLFPDYDGVVRCMQEDIMFNKITDKHL